MKGEKFRAPQARETFFIIQSRQICLNKIVNIINHTFLLLWLWKSSSLGNNFQSISSIL